MGKEAWKFRSGPAIAVSVLDEAVSRGRTGPRRLLTSLNPLHNPAAHFSRASSRRGWDVDHFETRRWRIVEMPKISDVRGNLTAIEAELHVPFQIDRVYYIYDVPSGSVRAGHAHRRLRQLFLALSGSFVVHVDDGVTKESITLNRPHIGLYVESGVWRVIDDFSGGGVCLVLASGHYDEGDYIRSYAQFQQYVGCKSASDAYDQSGGLQADVA